MADESNKTNTGKQPKKTGKKPKTGKQSVDVVDTTNTDVPRPHVESEQHEEQRRTLQDSRPGTAHEVPPVTTPWTLTEHSASWPKHTDGSYVSFDEFDVTLEAVEQYSEERPDTPEWQRVKPECWLPMLRSATTLGRQQAEREHKAMKNRLRWFREFMPAKERHCLKWPIGPSGPWNRRPINGALLLWELTQDEGNEDQLKSFIRCIEQQTPDDKKRKNQIRKLYTKLNKTMEEIGDLVECIDGRTQYCGGMVLAVKDLLTILECALVRTPIYGVRLNLDRH